MKLDLEVLTYAKSHPLWEDFEKVLVEQRPIIPVFDPNEDNTTHWKYESARREGFDLAMQLLKIEVEKNE